MNERCNPGTGGAPDRRRRRPLSPRSFLVRSLLVIGALAACSVEETQEVPWCDGGGSGLLAAQSVPSASQVPCLESLPAGWETRSVRIDQDGTSISFDSDRAGRSAAVLRFVERCDHRDAVAVPSQYPGVERFEYIAAVGPRFSGHRYFVFPGGCIWWEFDFDPDASAALSIELGDGLVLVSRRELNELIRTTFIDAEI